jgi:hypothetical protein
MILAGYDFTEAPDLVRMVGDALCRRPELFAGTGVDGRRLLALQERSQALRSFQGLLLYMAEKAGDLALYDQAVAVKEAMQAVGHVRQERAVRTDEARQRRLYLVQAEALLSRRQEKRRRRPAREAGPPSAQERALAAARDARAARAVGEIIAGWYAYRREVAKQKQARGTVIKQE